MARVGQGPLLPPPPWPWGGPRSVREKLVDPAQFERKRRIRKGDPQRPPLASADLLDFMGPGHASDELRLPPPPSGLDGIEGEISPFPDRSFTRQVVDRSDEKSRQFLERAIAKVQIPAERMERLRSLLKTEALMLGLLQRVQRETDDVIERMKAEYKATGQY
jgi:hypothetical protein